MAKAATKAKGVDYRLRIGEPWSDNQRNYSYVVRKKGQVTYITGEQKKLELSALVGKAAAELQFALEDAETPEAAKAAFDAVLAKKWKERPALLPSVEVL